MFNRKQKQLQYRLTMNKKATLQRVQTKGERSNTFFCKLHEHANTENILQMFAYLIWHVSPHFSLGPHKVIRTSIK